MMGKDPATVKGSTQPLLAPEQWKKETVTGVTPEPTIVPGSGDWKNCNGPQLVLVETHGELVSNERSGMMPEQPLVKSNGMIES